MGFEDNEKHDVSETTADERMGKGVKFERIRIGGNNNGCC